MKFDEFVRLNRGFDLPSKMIEAGPHPVVASTSTKAHHKVFKVKGPGVVTGRSGSLGAVQFVPIDFWPLNTALYVKNFKGNNPRFVSYFLSAMHLENFNSGAGVPTLNQNHLRRLGVFVPDADTQRKIAAALSAYDDLIENNRQRIALLERMAEQLYREWFVRFRFSGHGSVDFLKGLPPGWRLERLSSAVVINPTERPAREARPYVGMEDLSLTSMFFSSKERRPSIAGSKFRNRDVLFPRITPSLENGKRGFVMGLEDGQVGIGSTEFIVMRERLIGPEHIYFLSCSSALRMHAEQSMVGASGRQRVQEKCFDSFYVTVPPSELSQRFSAMVRPNFEQILVLARQNELLERARDVLLPRLISGKLRVDDLDIQVPPSMQDAAA